MHKELFSAISDIEGVLFGLDEISNALCVYHGRMEDEISIITTHFRGGSPETGDRMDTVLSVLTLSQKALKDCRAELEEAVDRAYAILKAQKTE